MYAIAWPTGSSARQASRDTLLHSSGSATARLYRPALTKTSMAAFNMNQPECSGSMPFMTCSMASASRTAFSVHPRSAATDARRHSPYMVAVAPTQRLQSVQAAALARRRRSPNTPRAPRRNSAFTAARLTAGKCGAISG